MINCQELQYAALLKPNLFVPVEHGNKAGLHAIVPCQSVTLVKYTAHNLLEIYRKYGDTGRLGRYALYLLLKAGWWADQCLGYTRAVLLTDCCRQ